MSTIQKTSRVHPGAGERDVVELSKRVEELSRQVAEGERPQLSSRLMETAHNSSDLIALTAATTVLVKHGLGRKVRGWKIVDIDAAATVYRDTSSSADLTVYLPLVASANCNVKLEVF